jgi:hypothetical protein
MIPFCGWTWLDIGTWFFVFGSIAIRQSLITNTLVNILLLTTAFTTLILLLQSLMLINHRWLIKLVDMMLLLLLRLLEIFLLVDRWDFWDKRFLVFVLTDLGLWSIGCTWQPGVKIMYRGARAIILIHDLRTFKIPDMFLFNTSFLNRCHIIIYVA